VPADDRPAAAAVVLAGGSGRRLGARLDGAPANKVYLPLAGRAMIAWSFVWASRVVGISTFVLVVRPEDEPVARRLLARDLPGLTVELVAGGASRHGSEQAALDHLAPRIRAGALDVVAVHDGARPLAAPAIWRQVIDAAAAVGGALPGLPADGVLRAADPGTDPGPLVRVQTPQAFRAGPLLDAYAAAAAAGFEGTDTAASMEAFGGLPVRVTPGRRTNLKVTFPHDVQVAERLLAAHGGSLE
jgi:2-C-methyl-D-erythritol 4-phosphate cytidylyltransferase